MCCAFLLHRAHEHLLLLLAFNRDEFLDRPTQTARFWEDHRDLLAGRDLQRRHGGTWLGLTRSGRFAFVTNFREANFNGVKDARSRGDLPVEFLTGSQSPQQYIEGINLQAYNGFNLVVGDVVSGEVAYISNRGGQTPAQLQPGAYGISNGRLDAKWPKVQCGLRMLEPAVQAADLASQQLPYHEIFAVLDDETRPEAGEVPRTGVASEWDKLCSSIRVPVTQREGGSLYGTRSQTVVAVWSDGRAELQERNINAASGAWGPTCTTMFWIDLQRCTPPS